MLVNCIRYTIDPARRAAFAAYAKGWTDIIGADPDATLIGYFLPTRIAGRTDTAYALIGFASLEAYAAYRERSGKAARIVASYFPRSACKTL